MQMLLEKIKEFSPLKQTLRQTCRQNGINISFLVEFSVLKTRKVMKKLQHKYNVNSLGLHCNWFQNELKLFHLTLVIFSYIHNIDIKKFDENKWIQIQQIFKNKDHLLLKYQALKFIFYKANVKKNWTHQQDELLKKIFEERQIRSNQSENTWNSIAVDLSIKSQNGFFKTKKQCKQRWFNHLNPLIKHGQWTEEEDKFIVSNVSKIGKKWLQISKQFEGKRTEHMIKNRYLSMCFKIRKSKPYIFEEETLLKELQQELGIQKAQSKLKRQQNTVKIQEDEKKVYSLRNQQNLVSQQFYQPNWYQFIYYPPLNHNIFHFQ